MTMVPESSSASEATGRPAGRSFGSKAAVVTAAVLLIVGISYSLWRLCLPDGRYDCPRFGAEGYSYLRFHEGRVTLQTPEAEIPFGNYSKEGSRWVWFSRYSEKFYLRASPLKIHVFQENGTEASGSPFRRVICK